MNKMAQRIIGMIDSGEKWFILMCIWHPFGQRLYIESLGAGKDFTIREYRRRNASKLAIVDYYLIAPRMIIMTLAAVAYAASSIVSCYHG